MAAKNTSAGMKNIEDVNQRILDSIAARLESSETLGATDITGKASTSENPSVHVSDFSVKSAVGNPGGVDFGVEEDLTKAMVVYSPPRVVEEEVPVEKPIAEAGMAEEKAVSGTESAVEGLGDKEVSQTAVKDKGWSRKKGTPTPLLVKESEEVGEASGGADVLTQLDQKVTDLAEDFSIFKGYVKKEFAELKKIMKDLLAKAKKA